MLSWLVCGRVQWGGVPPAAIRIFHKTLIKVKESDCLGLGGHCWDTKRWEWLRHCTQVIRGWVGWSGQAAHATITVFHRNLYEGKKVKNSYWNAYPGILHGFVSKLQRVEHQDALNNPPWYSAVLYQRCNSVKQIWNRSEVETKCDELVISIRPLWID